jgi:hypothetical protein
LTTLPDSGRWPRAGGADACPHLAAVRADRFDARRLVACPQRAFDILSVAACRARRPAETRER